MNINMQKLFDLFMVSFCFPGLVLSQNLTEKYVITTRYACVGPCVVESWSLLKCMVSCTHTRDCKAVKYNLATCCECTDMTLIDNPGQTPILEDTVYEPLCTVRQLVYEVPDSHFTASSMFNFYHGPQLGRINTRRVGSFSGAWSPAARAANQYIQVRFDDPKRIETVGTQGRDSQIHTECVSSYTVSYSIDCVTFTFVKGDNDENMVFPGNNDNDNIVWNDLPGLVVAVCVRITGVTFINYPSMRFGLKGCDW